MRYVYLVSYIDCSPADDPESMAKAFLSKEKAIASLMAEKPHAVRHEYGDEPNLECYLCHPTEYDGEAIITTHPLEE